MTGLQVAIREAREQAKSNPGRYLSGYPDLVMDDKTVLMTEEDYNRLKSEAGHYDSTMPTGVYIGKVWLRRWRKVVDGKVVENTVYLCWYGIDRKQPNTHCSTNVREVIVV